MEGAGKKLWGWYKAGKVWLPVQVDINGLILVDMSAIGLGDLGDVTIAGLADGHFISYSVGLGYWQNRLLAEGDIPADIARDAEVANAITAHAGLTTGIHGVGALHAAGFHTAGQAVSKVVWLDAGVQLVGIVGQGADIGWTDVDVTAQTSANAKIALIELGLIYRATTAVATDFILGVRKNGLTPAFFPLTSLRESLPQWTHVYQMGMIGLDAGQVLEYSAFGLPAWPAGATLDVYVFLFGYIE